MTITECITRVRHRYLRPAEDARLAIMVCGKVIAWGDCRQRQLGQPIRCPECFQ